MRSVTLILLSFFSACAWAGEVPSPLPLIDHVESLNFENLGKKKLSNFYSTQSCIFRSGDVLFIRNYCHEDKVFPAKSYFILSPRFGYHYFYEENYGQETIREVTINKFPEVVAQYWDGHEDLSLEDVDQLLRYLYQDRGGACWVTNFSRYQNGPHSSCVRDEIANYPLWKRETEAFVHDKSIWEPNIARLLALSRR